MFREDQVQALAAAATNIAPTFNSPYSDHHIGSAVLHAEGAIQTGCNVEFVTMQQSVNAERAALVNMASRHRRQLLAAPVVGPHSGAPCAECRHVPCEFACNDPDVTVVSAPTHGPLELLRLGDNYPRPYGPETRNIDPRNY